MSSTRKDATLPDCEPNIGVKYDAEVVHSINLASLNREFAVVAKTDEILTEKLPQSSAKMD